jgi:hypothetical protein
LDFQRLGLSILRIVLLSTLLLSFAAPSLADPPSGLGLTGWAAVNRRRLSDCACFHDNKRDEFAGTVGVDATCWVASLGAAWGATYLD